MMKTLDDVIMKFIRLKLSEYNVYVNEDIIWVFKGNQWVINIHEEQLITYNFNFFYEIKFIFDIDDDKLNKIIYLYVMNKFKIRLPLELLPEIYDWRATLEGINKREGLGLITTIKLNEYGTKTN